MSDKMDTVVVNEILYGVLAAMYKVSGGSAAAIMRLAGSKMLEDIKDHGLDLGHHGEDLKSISDHIEEHFEKAGLCDKFDFTQDETGVMCHIRGSAFADTNGEMKKHGIPEYANIFANLTMAIIAEALGKRCRIDKIEHINNSSADENIHIKFV